MVKPWASLDPKTLLALASLTADPRLMVTLAFQELAQNAEKIGQLNITPDLLSTLLEPTHGRRRDTK
jgi:hypothetical protein